MRLMKIGLAILAALGWSCRQEPSPPFADPDADMAALAQLAVEEAKRLDGTALTFDPPSVEHAEILLGAYHELHKTGELTDRQANVEALRWGAYIGETIKREVGDGHWDKDHPEIGADTFPLTYRNRSSFPLLWAYKRITSRPEDNVWHKYLHYVRGQDSADWEIIKHPLPPRSPEP